MGTGIIENVGSGVATGAMVGGPWGAVIGGVGALLSGLFGKRKAPNLQRLVLSPVTAGQDKFLAQADKLPGVADVIQQANALTDDSLRSSIRDVSPATFAALSELGLRSGDLMAGRVPGGRVSARDLGLTDADLMKLGSSTSRGAIEAAMSLTPGKASALDSLSTPASLLKAQDAEDTYNNEIANQRILAEAGAASQNPILSGISTGLGTLAGAFDKGTLASTRGILKGG